MNYLIDMNFVAVRTSLVLQALEMNLVRIIMLMMDGEKVCEEQRSA